MKGIGGDCYVSSLGAFSLEIMKNQGQIYQN
jgi:hypothetical protein